MKTNNKTIAKLVLCFTKMNQRTISLDLRSSEMNQRTNFKA
jgi:hypothetical protein